MFALDTIGRLVADDDEGKNVKLFEGRNSRPALNIITEGRCQRGDEVWVMLGIKEPLVLRRYVSELTIIGPAMLQEKNQSGEYTTSPIMLGSLYDRYKRGEEVRYELLRTI